MAACAGSAFASLSRAGVRLACGRCSRIRLSAVCYLRSSAASVHGSVYAGERCKQNNDCRTDARARVGAEDAGIHADNCQESAAGRCCRSAAYPVLSNVGGHGANSEHEHKHEVEQLAEPVRQLGDVVVV